MKGNWKSFGDMRATDQTWGSSRIMNKKQRGVGNSLGLNQFTSISWKSKDIWKRLPHTLVVFAARFFTERTWWWYMSTWLKEGLLYGLLITFSLKIVTIHRVTEHFIGAIVQQQGQKVTKRNISDLMVAISLPTSKKPIIARDFANWEFCIYESILKSIFINRNKNM